MTTTLRVAIRSFLRAPGFTATALTILALCLGANLAIFAVVDSVLLRPLPFPEPNRLVSVYNTYPKAGVERDGSSIANYYERRQTIPAFSQLSLIRQGTVIVGDAGATERADAARVTPDFFSTVGVGPVLGRTFQDAEMTFQTNDVVILSDGYWREHFNADPATLGRSMRIDGAQRTVVGILPPDFQYLSSRARLFLPLASDPMQRLSSQRHSGSNTEMVARLRAGATLAQAQAQLDAQDAAIEPTTPDAAMMAGAGFRSIVVGLHADHVASIRPTLVLLQAGVFLLLVIGSVNLVNLLLIRASGRARELAIRQSLGASPRHVVSQVLVETLALTVAGGMLGLIVGAGGTWLLSALGVEQLPLGARVAFDGRLAILSLAGAALLGLLIALPIAWVNVRGHLANALRSESRGGTAGRSVQRLRNGFIIAQVSLAFVLLAGSGLLGLSLRHAMSVSPGFAPDHVLTGQISLPRRVYDGVPRLAAFATEVIEGMRRQPGVVAVGAITNIPLSGNDIKSAFTVRGHVLRPGESLQGHYGYGVVGDYFSALGIPLRAGRLLSAADATGEGHVCVVDEDFAHRYWPDGNAVGQQIFEGNGEAASREPFTVVGVVGAVKQADVTESQAQGAVYLPFRLRADASFFVVTRTSQAPEAFGTTMVRVVRGLDPDVPVDDIRSMEMRVSDSLVARRSPALLAAIFAAVALALAAVGTYGVLSYAVSQRRREIGVRLALGAQPRQIGGQFLSHGARLLAGGTVLGTVGTWIANRSMQGVLFGVPPLPVAIVGATAVVVCIVSLVACVIPALRASRVDPLVAMGAE